MQKWLGIGLVGAVFVAACSTTAASPFPDVATFCNARAKAECQIAATCAIDPNACIAVRASACNTAAAAATSTGTRRYNADNAQPCIDAVKGVYANGKVTYSDLVGHGSMGDICEHVFQGSVDKNAACTSTYDCSGGRICALVAPGGSAQVCADSQNANTGDFCANPGTVCQSSYCAVSMTGAPQCVANPGQGQACSAAVPCSTGLRCAGGICSTQAVPGGACATSTDCSSAAQYCDPYVGTGATVPVCNAAACCTTGLVFAPGSDDCAPYRSAVVVQDAGPPADTGAPDTGAPSDSGSPEAGD